MDQGGPLEGGGGKSARRIRRRSVINCSVVTFLMMALSAVGLWNLHIVPRLWVMPSIHEEADAHAHDGGEMNEWREDWFVAHSSTTAGLVILTLEPGDVVEVDGKCVLIDAVTYAWPHVPESYIREYVGADAVCFQTCYDAEANMRLAYGHVIDILESWDEEAVSEHFDKKMRFVSLFTLRPEGT